MEAFKKDKKSEEVNILHKSGNIRELLKVGKSSNINLDISRLSGKGFSSLLEKAKKLQEIKKKDEKNREEKNDEIDLITKKGKENIKSNNNSLIKISNDFEILKKFSQRMNHKKINNILTSTDTQNSLKEENYYGITTTANTNTNSNINSNFNTEKTKTKESIDNGNNESKNEKEKENDESSIDYIQKTVTNNINMEKRKYSHFYSILNNLSSKNNNKSSIKSKFKQRNKNITIFNPDSLYQNSENIDGIDENKKNESHNYNESNTNYNDSKYNNESKNNNDSKNNNESKNNINETYNYNNKYNNETNHYNNDSKYYSETNQNKTASKSRFNNNESNSQNINKNQETLNLNEYQHGTANSCCIEDILNDLDNIHDSFEKNNNSKKDENSEDDNSFDLKLYEKYNNKNSFEGINSPKYNDNEINENYFNKEENDYDIQNKEKKEEKILNFEEEEIYREIDSKAIEYETVNSNYSIKQCNTVLEYSFREDQNISYCTSMEDKSKSIENFNNNKKQMLFQLFDGYKGEEVSNYLQQNFTHIYKQYLEENKGNIPRSLVKSFKEIDEKIKKIENFEGKSSTGTVVHIIWENKNKLMVYTGNVGNTRASLVSPVYIIKLSQDQQTPETKKKSLKYRYKKNIKNNILKKKSENEEEEKNNKIFGKYKMDEDEEIEKDKKYGFKRFNRLKYKKEKNINKNEESENKLECVPYIAKMEIDLNIKNQYLFLASDGIWDKIDEEEIQQIINNINDTEQLCSNIVKNVLHRDTKDNISIFSIKLT